MNTLGYNKNKKHKQSKKYKKSKNTKKRGGVETRKMKRKREEREEREEEEKSKDNECPVCLMPYTEMDCEKVNLNCGHVLCSGCLSKICKDKNNLAKCPLCRGNIKEDCDIINPIALVDSVQNVQNVHVFYDYGEVDEILQNGNIEDLVVYETNNQMGTMYYRISTDNDGNRYLRVVGDYHGLYSDDEYDSDEEVGFGGRKKRKLMRKMKMKKKQRKYRTKKNKQRKK